MTTQDDQAPVFENVPRGTLFALLVLPAGIALWLIIWNFGFIASVVPFAIAVGAGWLYKLGAGRVMSTQGVWRVIVITVVTIVAAIVAGYAWDVASVVQAQSGLSWAAFAFTPEFWQDVFAWMFNSANTFSLLLALVFGAIGCFSTLRMIRQAAKAGQEQGSPAAAPVEPGTQTFLPGQAAAGAPPHPSDLLPREHLPQVPPAPPQAASPAQPLTEQDPGAAPSRP